MAKTLPHVLDRGEAEALLRQPNTRCPTGLRNRAMLELMYRAGLRVSEVVNLRPSDVRWQSRLVEVRNGKGNKDRAVPVDEATVGWLQAWSARRPPRGHRFFCTLHGGSLSTRYVQAAVKRYAVRALGAERARAVSPHVLRHTYATELLDEGFTIREVQALLGHANVGTTQIYTHVRPSEIARKFNGRATTDVDCASEEELLRQVRELGPKARQALQQILKSVEEATQ